MIMQSLTAKFHIECFYMIIIWPVKYISTVRTLASKILEHKDSLSYTYAEIQQEPESKWFVVTVC